MTKKKILFLSGKTLNGKATQLVEYFEKQGCIVTVVRTIAEGRKLYENSERGESPFDIIFVDNVPLYDATPGYSLLISILVEENSLGIYGQSFKFIYASEVDAELSNYIPALRAHILSPALTADSLWQEMGTIIAQKAHREQG